MSDITENLDESKKILIVGLAGILFSLILSLFMYLAGISLILNASIVLSLFVVLACTLAFAINEKTRVVSEEKEEVDNSKKEFLPMLSSITDLIQEIDQKLAVCEKNLSELGKSFPGSAREQVNAVNRIRTKLKERANVIEHMLESNQIEKIDEVKKIINEPLTFPVDSVNSLVTESSLEIPDLPRDKWDSAVETIFQSIAQEA